MYHTKVPNWNNQRIKWELTNYGSEDHWGAVMWVNKMEGIFKSKPLFGEREKKMTISNNLERESYYWFLRWTRKCDVHSFHWQSFMTKLLKIFHDEDDSDLYNKFVHLKQKVM